MKVLGFIAFFILVLTAALVLIGQLGFLHGQAPTDLGVRDGRLKPPSDTPNSVSSQAELYPTQPQRAYASIAPFAFKGTGEQAMNTLANILKNTERCVLVNQQPGYLYAQCSTALMHFTDDVEFWLDTTAGVVQVRSASRLGRGDLGANRSRVEKIRAQFIQN
ncbi:DUF1499 domain-containing protein [Rhodoferax lacus]|uniref:DUF1499 domain-containing protein n=1 Tax=Rhodoferax lacus TaxID=2184758 RepID=A0A3E1RHZ2_9BURK|nr:DUF1499 domain-containing protein [Rhodoferax lacus]RFO98851.1 DUF1499 domain-containing protein [Rhodoferax lacus]